MDPYIGRMLDNRYEILECIGTGGMAVVYKAKCHRLNRLVAIKILKSDLAQDADFRRRFNAESQAVAQLSHPNIMSVYDVSRGGDIEYIVMELIDGITLKQYMEKRGQLNWRESLHFITQIMRGLSHAHSRGIIHRDIKPQNIMVLRDGSVRVADFGIACLENSAQTLTQEALGSVHYISPEQAKGDRADARSDIYSAGVVLYEMLTGRLPFEGESAVSVAIQHLSSIPLAPREVRDDVPEQLELICMKAMASDRDRRYPTAEEMISDLESFRKNPNVDLDIELSDLRPEETDEPTMLLGGSLHAAKSNQKAPHGRQDGYRRRSYEEDDDEEDDYLERRSDIRKILLATIAVLAALIVGVLLFRTIVDSFDAPPVEAYRVPSVVGMTLEEATASDILGTFTLVEAGSEFHESVPQGVILRQEPEKDELRKGDSTEIKVWISAGEDVGEMIDVEDLTLAQARVAMQALIKKYDLVIEASEEYEEYSETVTAGCIISSIPEQGAQLKKGDTIVLVVSKGPEFKEIVVPPFVGQNIERVMAQLSNYKLTCDYADIELVDSDRPGGEIIWQSLEPATTALEWDAIKFRVSSGLMPEDAEMWQSYDLPQDGREEVLVEVYVGGDSSPQYSDTHLCTDESVSILLTGTGTQTVRVFYDGALYHSYELQFGG